MSFYAGLSWTVPGQYYPSVEATAYAVLALVKTKDLIKQERQCTGWPDNSLTMEDLTPHRYTKASSFDCENSFTDGGTSILQ